MFPGISDRMQKELTSLSPASMKVRDYYGSSALLGRSSHFTTNRSKSSHPQSENTPCGSEGRFWRPLVRSKTCGVPSKSTTNPALASFIAVRSLSFFLQDLSDDSWLAECF